MLAEYPLVTEETAFALKRFERLTDLYYKLTSAAQRHKTVVRFWVDSAGNSAEFTSDTKVAAVLGKLAFTVYTDSLHDQPNAKILANQIIDHYKERCTHEILEGPPVKRRSPFPDWT